MSIKSKPRIIKMPIRSGEPLNRSGIPEAINALTTALENLDIRGGRIEWANGRPLIIIDED